MKNETCIQCGTEIKEEGHLLCEECREEKEIEQFEVSVSASNEL